MIFTSELSKVDARELFQRQVDALQVNAAAYVERSGIDLPVQAEEVAERVLAAGTWFEAHLMEVHLERVLPYPIWWNASHGSAEHLPSPGWDASPFTSWQLRLIDELQAWYWLSLETALPHLQRVIRRGARADFRNNQPALLVEPKWFESPLGLIYGLALRLSRGDSSGSASLSEHLRSTTDRFGRNSLGPGVHG